MCAGRCSYRLRRRGNYGTSRYAAALQAETRSAAAPAGSLVAYCIDTFHRGTNMVEPNGRYTMTVSFKRADNANIGFHVWQHAVDRPLASCHLTTPALNSLAAWAFPTR